MPHPVWRFRLIPSASLYADHMIDLHAHYLSPSVLAAASKGLLPASWDENRRVIEFPSGPSDPVLPGLSDLEERIRWNSERGIDIQVLAPWMDITGDDLDPGQARIWCEAMNDGLAHGIDGNAQFRALAALPLVNGGTAAGELRRCVGEFGFSGGAIPSQVNGQDLDEAGLEPLWEAAEDLGVLLFMHPYRVMGGRRMGRDHLGNVCGFPFDTTLAAMRLYFSEVFTTWPRLKILLAHGGGTLPYLAGRAAHASRYVPTVTRRVDHPDEILQMFYYDTMLHDPRALVSLIRTVGTERVVGGTDAPFPMWVDDPVEHIEGACRRAGVGRDALERVLHGTAAGLLTR